MADGDKKPGGLLAIMLGKKKGGDDEEDDGGSGKEPRSKTARALKSMYENLEGGDYNAAAEDFKDAYEACASGSGEDEEEHGEDGGEGDEDDGEG